MEADVVTRAGGPADEVTRAGGPASALAHGMAVDKCLQVLAVRRWSELYTVWLFLQVWSSVPYCVNWLHLVQVTQEKARQESLEDRP